MSQIPEGSIIITPVEVYAEVRTLTEIVRELVGNDKAEVRDRAALKAEVDRLRTDVDGIQRKIWFASGVAAAAGGGIGSAIASTLLR